MSTLRGKIISQDRLKQLVTYEPDTGLVRCAATRQGSNRKVGDVLGSPTKCGHLELRIDGRSYHIHRLAFIYMTGSLPKGVVDHINRNPADNRWENLRDTTQFANCHNRDDRPEKNKTGFVGVHERKGRYIAKIVVGHRQVQLGSFDNPLAASLVYKEAKQKLQPVAEAA